MCSIFLIAVSYNPDEEQPSGSGLRIACEKSPESCSSWYSCLMLWLPSTKSKLVCSVVSARVLGGERQVEKQAFRQHADVVQVAERGGGASPVGAAVVGHVDFLALADPERRALLGLLVLLDLCVQAVALLFGHSAKLDRCDRRMGGPKRFSIQEGGEEQKVGGGKLMKYRSGG
ncbi:hypothetical protein EYF80_020516 [Liparis tanakae]|uniref:Uncharacterized protein n=1 Tax=Liparis tanakae TaxID=230148 RepID=A0A4Z2HTQ6_9TELE|nr:hypothetical protein EYF80_020516 [Liparis tanakae]